MVTLGCWSSLQLFTKQVSRHVDKRWSIDADTEQQSILIDFRVLSFSRCRCKHCAIQNSAMFECQALSTAVFQQESRRPLLTQVSFWLLLPCLHFYKLELLHSLTLQEPLPTRTPCLHLWHLGLGSMHKAGMTLR